MSNIISSYLLRICYLYLTFYFFVCTETVMYDVAGWVRVRSREERFANYLH